MKFEEAVGHLVIQNYVKEERQSFAGIWTHKEEDDLPIKDNVDGLIWVSYNDTGVEKDCLCISFKVGDTEISLDLRLQVLARWVNSIINRERM